MKPDLPLANDREDTKINGNATDATDGAEAESPYGCQKDGAPVAAPDPLAGELISHCGDGNPDPDYPFHTCVYVLKSQCGVPFYAGTTSDPTSRFNAHQDRFGELARGVRMHILYRDLPREVAELIEEGLIAGLVVAGAPLRNQTGGGNCTRNLASAMRCWRHFAISFADDVTARVRAHEQIVESRRRESFKSKRKSKRAPSPSAAPAEVAR